MNIDFLELLEYAQNKVGNDVYDKFLSEISNLDENSNIELEIRIPEIIIEEYLQHKLDLM